MKTKTHLRQWLAITLLGTAYLMVIAGAPADAQTMFQRTYSNSFAFGDYGESVRQTSDGGYIQAGHRAYFSLPPLLTSNVILSKTTSTGALVWTHNLTQQNSQQHEKAYAVREIITGGKSRGYIVVGSTTDGNGSKDFLVIRTDVNGYIVWRKTWGTIDKDDEAMNVEVLPNEEFIVTGYADLDNSGSAPRGQKIALLYLNQFGNKIWDGKYGFTFPTPGTREMNIGQAVMQISGGDFVVVGCSKWSGPGNENFGPSVLRVQQATGFMTWGHVYATQPGAPESFGTAESVIENQAGNIVVAGWLNQRNGTFGDAFLAEFNPTNGNPNWFRTYDCSLGDDYGFDLTVPSIGGGQYVMSGISNGRVFQMLLGINGTAAIWAEQYLFTSALVPYFVGVLDANDASVRMMRTTDNGFVLEANSGATGFYLIKTDFLGHTNECEYVLPVSVDQFDPTLHDLAQFYESRDVMIRDTITNDIDFVLNACNPADLDKHALPGVSGQSALPGFSLRSNTITGGSPIELIFPRNAEATVRVVDMSGRTVYSEPASAGSTSIGTDGWSSGVYRVEVTANGAIESWSVSVTK